MDSINIVEDTAVPETGANETALQHEPPTLPSVQIEGSSSHVDEPIHVGSRIASIRSNHTQSTGDSEERITSDQQRDGPTEAPRPNYPQSLPDEPDHTRSKIFDSYDFIDDIQSLNMYTPFATGPAKSIDFGDSGWTASMNIGQEFLQLTAPDTSCGLTYVRGAFDNNPSAILARAQQKEGGRSSFGIKVMKNESGYSWDPTESEEWEGLVNFRWPYSDQPLNFKGSEVGSMTRLSFVRKGTVYQVIRFVHTDRPPNTHEDIDSEIDSIAQKRYWKSREQEKGHQADREVKFRLGGMLRFGCPCQTKPKQQKGYHWVVGRDSALICRTSNYKQRLEMKLFVNGEAVNIVKEEKKNWGSEVEAVFEHKINLISGQKTLVIATFKFTNKYTDEVSNDPLPTSEQLIEELGISETSEFATDRVWIRQIEEIGGWDYQDCCGSGACLEQILGVTSVPVHFDLHHREPPIAARFLDSEFSPGSKRSSQRSSIENISIGDKASIKNYDNLSPFVEDGIRSTSNVGSCAPSLHSANSNLDMARSRILSLPPKSDQIQKDSIHSTAPVARTPPINASPPENWNPTTPFSPKGYDVVNDEPQSGEILRSYHRSQKPFPDIYPPSLADSEQDLKSIPVNFAQMLKDSRVGNLRSMGLDPTGTMYHPTPVLKGTALLGGILSYQYVDMERSLWQLRFLVKVHQFITAKSVPNMSSPPPPGDPPVDHIRRSLLGRVEYTLSNSMTWITHVQLRQACFTSPALHHFRHSRRKGCSEEIGYDFDNDRTLYPPIVVWYILRNCPGGVPQNFIKRLTYNIAGFRLQYQGDERLENPDNKAKLCILLWYFYGCLAELYTKLLAILDEFPLTSTFEQEKKDCTKKAKAWKKRSEKAMAAISKHGYSDELEIVDRLAFLGIELGLVAKEALSQTTSCVYQARRRILTKTATKDINPGVTKFTSQNGTTRVPNQAPWELTCLNHHSRAIAALWSEKEIEAEYIQSIRNDTNRFLTANFTFVGTWNQNRGPAAWWDLDTTCVIQATHLDLRMRSNKEAAEKFRKDIAAAMILPPSPVQLAEEPAAPTAKVDNRPRKEAPEDGVLELLKIQIEQQLQLLQGFKSESDVAVDYNWLLSDPGTILHQKEWVESLDDTPELFKSGQRKEVGLRQRLLKYLVDRLKENTNYKVLARRISDIKMTAERLIVEEVIFQTFVDRVHSQTSWSKKTLANDFDVQDLKHLTVVNIEVRDRDDGQAGVSTYGRLHIPQSVRHKKLVTNSEEMAYIELPFYKPSDDNTPEADELARPLWLEYLDDNIDQGASLSGRLKIQFDSLPIEKKAILVDEEIRERVMQQYKDNLLEVLSDSLVDSSTRFRIFYLQRCSPDLVRALIHMWHPSSIDTFDEHFGDGSNFFNTNKQVWITSITIPYWAFKRQHPDALGRFNEGRDKARFPPKNVIPLVKTSGDDKYKQDSGIELPPKFIEEKSSSLVISGDLTGNFWICSVISSVLPESVISKATNNVYLCLQQFAYQESSGRCLVILYYLGLFCEHISQEYEDILNGLTHVIKLDREVLKRGLKKSRPQDSITMLKSMLWALEVLRILDDKLGESLDTIAEARLRMLKVISRGPGKRHEYLERVCQSLIEDFGKRNDRLTSIHSKIEQKIVQITRYREGIIAVSNLEDTHTALTQNETLRVLTYITISYLPLSFVVAVFSMDLVITSNWSARVFAGMIVAFIIGTLVLAGSLGWVILSWEKFIALLTRRRGKGQGRDLKDGSGSDTESNSESEDEIDISEKAVKNPVVGKDEKKGDRKGKGEETANAEDVATARKWLKDYARRWRSTAVKMDGERDVV